MLPDFEPRRASLVPEALERRLIDRIARFSAARRPRRADLYRDFFICSNLGVLGAERGGAREDVLLHLAARQVLRGPERGSWDLSDAWTPAGGRLRHGHGGVDAGVEERCRRLGRWTSGRGGGSKRPPVRQRLARRLEDCLSALK